MASGRFIEWQDEMAIGVEPFDREHRDLVESINRLHEVAVAPVNATAFTTAVERLIHVTEAHFTHEETVLRHHGCPNLGMHQREHDELLEDVSALRLLGNDPGELVGMLEMLRHWLLDHIVHFDRDYRGCLAGKEIR